jgi:protein-S-isoprenylcysteine O-methyltransferase Ste14
MYDYPFHMLYLVYAFWMVSLRAYYTGYVAAAGETVSREEEGAVLRTLRGCFGIPFLGGVLLYLINPAWMAWSHLPIPFWLRGLGMVLLLISLLVYRWTHLYLGKNFTDTVYIREKSVLIVEGPYKWVRHPMYTSALLSALGTGVGLANWFIGITGTVLILMIMIWRTPLEEERLICRHGDDYKRYMRKTGKFIPKIF